MKAPSLCYRGQGVETLLLSATLSPHAAVPTAPLLKGESGSGRGLQETPREHLFFWGFLEPSAAE